MVASTGLVLAAGRFGLAPTVARGTTAGLKLVDRSNAAGVISNDPSGEAARALPGSWLGCRLASYLSAWPVEY
jgi:photosystem I reaction center PsaK